MLPWYNMTTIGVEYKLKIIKRMNVTWNKGDFMDKNILISNNIYRSKWYIIWLEFDKNKLYKNKEN